MNVEKENKKEISEYQEAKTNET